MAKRATLSTGARRALVRKLISDGLVHSQSDLVELLASEGIAVTQATASRDIEEIGAIRSRDQGGVLRYQILENESSSRSKLNRVSDELILSMSASGNLVVVKTPAGGAQLLASRLDRGAAVGELKSLIGTIAGDDTVLAISKSATGGVALAKALGDFMSKRRLTKK